MPDVTAKGFADCNRGLVIAPAGCGKTHLISEAVQLCANRQLVLTHTHAGVKAIRDRMVQLKVPQDLYRISTLHAFALRYASAFPTLSGWTVREPQGEQWQQLCPAATKILRTKVVDAVLRASYAGVFVDEYQDCSISQHELVAGLASVLPCRVLGDPLQSIFSKINKQEALAWSQVEATFPKLGELGHPHRWVRKNEALGLWLLEIRKILLQGGEIDFQGVECITFRQCDPQAQALTECLRKLDLGDETVVALRQKREQCHYLAGKLKNRFTVFEDAHCEDLMEWAIKIDGVQGTGRVKMLIQFAQRWLTRLPKSAISPVVTAVQKGKPQRAHRSDLLRLGAALETVRDKGDLRAITEVLDAFLEMKEEPTFKSKEVWWGLHHAAANCTPNSNKSLREAAWQHRDFLRRNGRQPPRRCLATPLLVKGLEFDHSLILNAADFPDAEDLYVCLTRASRTVTILAESPRVSVCGQAN